MSHNDDPTKESPAQGGADSATAKASLPDITTREFVETLKTKTGKTEDEILAMDDKTLQELMAQSFEKPDGGKPESVPKESTGSSAASTVPSEQKPAEKKPDDEVEVAVQIKPSLLKPFSTAGDLKQAIGELVKKAKEGTDTIDVLQKRTIPNLNEEIARRDRLLSTVSTENATLKSELDALRAKKPAEQQQSTETPAAVDEELPEIPDLGNEEFDPFNQEDRKKFTDALKVMRKRDEIFSKKIKALSTQKPEKQEPPKPAAEKPTPTEPPARGLDDEYQAARALQSNAAFGDLMRTSRDITAINNDYVDFGKKLATYFGISKHVDENGLFTPEVNTILGEYFNPLSAEGDKIRNAAKARGIEPPAEDDLKALRRIGTIRNIQKSRYKRDERGATVPISEDEAFAIAQSTNPNLFKKADPVADRRQEAERTAAAIANRNQHTVDVPPAVGAEITNVDRIPFDKFMEILTKTSDKWNVEEANMVKAVCKANHIGDEELKFLIDEKQKPKS